MIIRSLHIDSFGSLKNRDFDFTDGLNIIEGENESGKSTVAMFIKFMLYGLSGRKNDGEIPDKNRYASWDTGMARGYMIIGHGDTDYKIEREYFAYSGAVSAKDSSADRCTVTDMSTGERVFRGQVPGVALMGIPEQLFVNTVFVRQLSDGKIDGTGMAEAIENLLMSGDEGISTKKAIDRLEKERVSLKHKTGSGGLINELQREKLRLTQRLNTASAESADIIALESSVEELEQTVSRREEEYAELSELCDSYDKITDYRRRLEARGYLAQLHETDEKIQSYDMYGDIPAAQRSIIEQTAALRAADERRKILRRREGELDAALSPVMSEEEKHAGREDVAKAKKVATKRGKNIVMGVLLLILAIGAIGADLYFKPAMGLIFMGVGVLLFVLSLIFIVTGGVNCRRFSEIMRRWDVSSVTELEKTVNRKINHSEQRTSSQSEYGMTVSALQRAEAERISVITELRETASVFTEEMTDTDLMAAAALEKATQIEEELSALSRHRNELYGKYTVLTSSFGRDASPDADREAEQLLETERGTKAGNMTREAAEDARRRLKFAETSLPSLRSQLSDKKSRLGVLRATTATPADIAIRIEETEKQLREATARYESIIIAKEALTEAGDSLRRGLMPKVRHEAERIMGNFTDGKYCALGVDRGFDVTFDADGKTREAVFFSAGTRDIAYISLRTALAHVLFSYGAPPVIYDESFARVDEGRLERILRFLSSAGNDGVQSLVFTCRSAEGKLSEGLGDVTVIKL